MPGLFIHLSLSRPDRHNRTRIAAELGITDIPQINLDIEPDQAERIAVELNTARRQMNTKVRREIVKALRESGYSQRAIAGAAGVSQPQVNRDLARDTYVSPRKTTGLDGKTYPAKRAKPRAKPGPIQNPREEMRANSMNERMQIFLSQMRVGLGAFLGQVDLVLPSTPSTVRS